MFVTKRVCPHHRILLTCLYHQAPSLKYPHANRHPNVLRPRLGTERDFVGQRCFQPKANQAEVDSMVEAQSNLGDPKG